MRTLAAEHGGRWPKTVTLKFDRLRCYLLRAAGMEVCSFQDKLGKGINVLGKGQFVPGPGSLLPSGRKCRFAVGRALRDAEIRKIPEWLTKLIVAPTEPEAAAVETASASNSAIRELSFHPLADVFPLLDENHLRELAQDIAQRGLLDPIVLHEGQILDGRCRYLACQMAGAEPRFENYVGHDPLSYVARRNALRRHLNESQRAIVAAKLAALKLGANQHSEGLPIGRAAAMLNVSERTVARAREVLGSGVPDLVK